MYATLPDSLLRQVQSPPTEEESIALGILPDTRRVISLRIELLPHAGRVDVLVALIPSAIYHLGHTRIVGVAFQLRVWDMLGLLLRLLLCAGGGCGEMRIAIRLLIEPGCG